MRRPVVREPALRGQDQAGLDEIGDLGLGPQQFGVDQDSVHVEVDVERRTLQGAPRAA